MKLTGYHVTMNFEIEIVPLTWLTENPFYGGGRDKHICCQDCLLLWLCHTHLSGSLHLTRLLGNSGKPVTLETLGLTKFSKHVFQEQGIHDFRKPGTRGASNSRICKVRGSWFGEEVESRTCGSPESWTVDGPNLGGQPIRESVEGWLRESGAWTCANQRRSEGQFGKLLKTLFESFMRRHSRTRREAKSELLCQKVRV
jgi:hypothetical protein